MNLSKFSEVLARQRNVVIGVLAAGVVLFIVTLPHFRKYTATSTLLAAQPSSSDVSVLDPSKDPIASSVGINDLEVLAQSATVIDRVASDLNLSPKEAKRLPGEVKAKSVFNSDVLPVAVSDPDPDLAVREVNALADELRSYSRTISTSRYDELIADLGRQVASTRAALASIDGKIARLTNADFYITADAGTAALSTRLIALQQQEQQLAATVDGDQANARAFAARPALTRHLADHEIVATDPAFEQLKTQYGKDLAQLNNEKAGYTDKFAGLAGLQDEVDRERASLDAAQKRATADATQSQSYVAAMLDVNKADATLAADSAQLATVRGQLADLDHQLAGSGPQGNAIAQLRRDRGADEASFADLSQRLSKAVADRSQAASIGSVVIVDRAIAAHPALLARPGVLAIAFTVAFVWLSFTLAFFLDNADKRLAGPDSIEELYGKPVFTTVG